MNTVITPYSNLYIQLAQPPVPLEICNDFPAPDLKKKDPVLFSYNGTAIADFTPTESITLKTRKATLLPTKKCTII
jgi:hypothetical protein